MSVPQVDLFSHLSISSAVAHPVKAFPTLAKEKGLQILDLDCGVSMSESFASYDHDSSSWKTSQRSLLGGLTSFSGTWPRQGMMRSGAVFRRLTSERRTADETGSLSWPTPRACSAMAATITAGAVKRAPERVKAFPNLETVMTIIEPEPVGKALTVAWVSALMGFPPDWCSLPDGLPVQIKPKKVGKPRGSRSAKKTGKCP
jgi:hypothetical protein